MFRSTGGGNKQKMLVKTTGREALIDKCLSVTPNVKVHMLENIHEMVCESKIIQGVTGGTDQTSGGCSLC